MAPRAALLAVALLALAAAPGPSRADFLCTQTLRAQFRSLFVAQRPWAAAEDTAQLCELCAKVARYGLLYANDPDTRAAWGQTVRDNACTYAERHREADCELLAGRVVDAHEAFFTGDKARMPPADRANTLDTAARLQERALQFCTETMCCPLPAAPAAGAAAANGTAQQEPTGAAGGEAPATGALQPGAKPAAAPAAPAPAPAAAAAAAPKARNGSANATTPSEARSIHFNRTAAEIRAHLEEDRETLDGEKRVFDRKAAFLDAYRARLDKRDEELKRAQQEVEKEKRLIAQGIVKRQMEKRMAEEEEKRTEKAKKREEERKEEAEAQKRQDDNTDAIEKEAAKKKAAASDPEKGERDAAAVRAQMHEEAFKSKVKAFNDRKKAREAEEKKEAEERAETDKKREAAAGVAKGGTAAAAGSSSTSGGDETSGSSSAPASSSSSSGDLAEAKKFRAEDREDDGSSDDDEEYDDDESSS